jgi:hypothetical protein
MNQGFSYYFSMMIEGSGSGSRAGSGSGSIPMTSGSGSGSRRPKNMWIRNTARKPKRMERAIGVSLVVQVALTSTSTVRAVGQLLF